MQVDYSIELGKDDPALELPWSAEDGALRYYDLKSDPGLVSQVPETDGCPELADFLTRINAPAFPLQTAKCDVWQTRDLSPEEQVFKVEWKFVSYVDVIFAAKVVGSKDLDSAKLRSEALRSEGRTDSRVAENPRNAGADRPLGAADESPRTSDAGNTGSAADENLRYSFEAHESLVKGLCALLARVPEMPASAEFVVRRCYFHTATTLEKSCAGFCVTAYVFGFGESSAQARLRWAIAVKLVQHALVQWANL
ncbi:MAG: hypothetical protein LAO20_05855 [Acidobacteriia bacterium]|nr:hypothetical protein [Terriglobia bacterium]